MTTMADRKTIYAVTASGAGADHLNATRFTIRVPSEENMEDHLMRVIDRRLKGPRSAWSLRLDSHDPSTSPITRTYQTSVGRTDCGPGLADPRDLWLSVQADAD